jgi:hypothetical protein
MVDFIEATVSQTSHQIAHHAAMVQVASAIEMNTRLRARAPNSCAPMLARSVWPCSDCPDHGSRPGGIETVAGKLFAQVGKSRFHCTIVLARIVS